MERQDSSKISKDSEGLVNTDAVVESLTLKERAGDAANNWLAKNRSLVLRQTPVWAQSLAVILILLGSGAVIEEYFLESRSSYSSRPIKVNWCVFEVKTPVGGKISMSTSGMGSMF